MIRIGEFANLFDVSIKTIRLYEEKGLLEPCYVDIYSGYRYYNEDNVREMTKILALKDLGLSLKDIKNYDNSLIESKIFEYEKQIKKMNDNLHTLKSLSQNKEEIQDMKPFIKDEEAIGKWKLLGVAVDLDNAKKMNFEEDDLNIRELYLMPNGEEYWAISWTRGFICVKDTECPYVIEGNKLYLNLIDPNDKSFYTVAVYERVDNKEYNISNIDIYEDDINVPFVEDNKLKGTWQMVDYVRKPELFNPNKKHWDGEEYLKKIIVTPDNECFITSIDPTKQVRYTKNYFIGLCGKRTLSKYEYVTINNSDYIIVEWKSGDYTFANLISGYYVLQRIN